MSQLQGALETFMKSLAELEQTLTQRAGEGGDHKNELEQANEVCAHLRAEISVLKKDLKRQLAANEKAGREIDSVLAKLDGGLEQADG